ncbi:CHAD domain-containing protein [Geobacter grbiciae]|uniref:CHAD domain-containing protein n=1 Tax=Geobacter grbiciae TaxID=155042 RepID=UPI001C020903|nr:CHAD domain-containing protein [Geobacter grbiciae]MBT1075182.1 CHAD domain-containing protein [Geobacter grbiciae]
MTITDETPLWVAAPALLAARTDDFFGRWRRALKTLDPEDIHDLRVSSRRLREGCVLFSPLYPDGLARVVRRVRKVTRLLGPLRNADEAVSFFRELSAALPEPCREGLGVLMDRQEALRNVEHRRLAKGLESFGAGKTNSAFVRAMARPAVFPQPHVAVDSFTRIGSFAAAALDGSLADLLPLVPAARDAGAAAAQHALRIAVKHYRYRIEILSFLMAAKGYGDIHATIKSYQDCLGIMHDLDVFADMVRHGGLPPEVECVILNAIAKRRGKSFAHFAELLGEHSFELIREEVRRAL